jgi:hypothetical protein
MIGFNHNGLSGFAKPLRQGALTGWCMMALAGTTYAAQPPEPLAPGAQLPPAAVSQPPKAGAPIDLTGTWVAVINEEWRWRMVTPPKGDYASVPLNPAGRKVADTWDISQDGSCKAYGAGGLMRLPTRVRISWEGEDVLKIETDAGQQTRRLVFGKPAPAGTTPSLQGYSVARWNRTMPPLGNMGFNFGPPRPNPPGGSLEVVTTNLTDGWLRRNGVPYSASARVTEHFDRFPSPNGDEWFMVTTIVEDPAYLVEPFVTSSHFKREPDNSKWDPTPCK